MVGAERLEDAVVALGDPVELVMTIPRDGSLVSIDGGPLTGPIDPATIEWLTFNRGVPTSGTVSQIRAGFSPEERLEFGFGDGGAQVQRFSGTLYDGDGSAVMGQFSHTRGAHDRWSGSVDGRLREGSDTIGGFRGDDWSGFGRSASAWLGTAIKPEGLTRLRVLAAWNRVVRNDAFQFRRDSATAEYDGLGSFDLDLLTAPVQMREERLAVIDVGDRLDRMVERHSWTARCQWLERTMDWVSNPDAPAVPLTRRVIRFSVEDLLRFEPPYHFSVFTRASWSRIGDSGTEDDDRTVGSAAVGVTARLVEGVRLFADLGRETTAAALPSGEWRESGGRSLVVGLPNERRDSAQIGVRVFLFGEQVIGSVAYFDERTDNAAFRDWAWEAAHPAGLAMATGRVDAIRYGVWPRWSRGGWRTEWSVRPLSSLTVVLNWYEDGRDNGPVHGGNRRGMFMTRYEFEEGALEGFSIGGGFEYRNDIRFNDGYTMPGGVRWNLLLGYKRKLYGSSPTEIRLVLRNLEGDHYQPTRFARDRGRQVFLTVGQEF